MKDTIQVQRHSILGEYIYSLSTSNRNSSTDTTCLFELWPITTRTAVKLNNGTKALLVQACRQLPKQYPEYYLVQACYKNSTTGTIQYRPSAEKAKAGNAQACSR